MADRLRKGLMAVQVLLLLLPATLLVTFILVLSYPAWPARHLSLPQLAFDLGLALTIGALAIGWRLGLAYLRVGQAGVQRAHRAWFALLMLGALIGLAGAAVAAAHLADPVNPGVSVGFALLAPGALLVPLAAQLGIVRGRARARA